MSAAPLGALADGVGIARMVPTVAAFLTLLVLAPWVFVRAVRGLDDAARPKLAEATAPNCLTTFLCRATLAAL
jgi:hypothetical protein